MSPRTRDLVRPRLYRGSSAHAWEQAFLRQGWPTEAAHMMSGFLVGYFRTPPSWKALTDHPRAKEKAPARAGEAEPSPKRPGWRERNR